MTGQPTEFQACASLLERFGSAKVLVLGDVMLDRFVYGSIERISPEAPIPVMREDRVRDMPGGAGNVVRNCAALGAAEVTLVAVVGADGYAAALGEKLSELPRVKVRLVPDSARPTTVKTRYVAERQQVLRADRESVQPVNDALAGTLLAEFEAALPAADVVILSDYAKGALSDAVTSAAIALAAKAGKKIIVDPKSRSFAKYRGATLLTPNRHELQLASTGECRTDEQIVAAARTAVDSGICRSMVVTRGADGMSIIQADSELHLPTIAQEVFDVSGAGDTVLAALAMGLAAGGSLATSSRLANMAAGIVVSKLGTAVATAAELNATLETLSGVASDKLYSVSRAVQQVQNWREHGSSIAFTNGCFDLLHPGHVTLLSQARKTADRLVVGINSDASVRRLKGPSRPAQGEMERAAVLASLKAVDAVVIFTEDTPLELIRALQPDVLVKGSDYSVATVVGADVVQQRGGKVVLVDLVQGYSTTRTIGRLSASG